MTEDFGSRVVSGGEMREEEISKKKASGLHLGGPRTGLADFCRNLSNVKTRHDPLVPSWQLAYSTKKKGAGGLRNREV